jgi:1,4-dihydroxy-2-naphthoyl-CoA hydrolase
MPFAYHRTVHFADTDAAAVVFFANYFAICHEAYEESLEASGIGLKAFFADNGVIIPISKSEADFRRPLSCGDKLRVEVHAMSLSMDSFEVRYEIFRLGPPEKSAARIRTEHVCLDSATRSRKVLPSRLSDWIRAV